MIYEGSLIYSILDKLHNLYDEYNYNDPIDKFIFRALKNEFSNELLNKRNGANEAYLSLEIDNIKVFEISFNNKDILSFSSENNQLPIKDSTLIEGPYVFQLAPLVHDLSFRESISRKSSINSQVLTTFSNSIFPFAKLSFPRLKLYSIYFQVHLYQLLFFEQF